MLRLHECINIVLDFPSWMRTSSLPERKATFSQDTCHSRRVFLKLHIPLGAVQYAAAHSVYGNCHSKNPAHRATFMSRILAHVIQSIGSHQFPLAQVSWKHTVLSTTPSFVAGYRPILV